jgi:hypothetical protein
MEADATAPTGGGFPPGRGPEITARDIRAEEEILERMLGSLGERRARLDQEITAEITEAIARLGIDWGHPRFRDRYDGAARDDLLRSALANPVGRGVVRDYVAHLQEHRAEFLSAVLDETEAGDGDR